MKQLILFLILLLAPAQVFADLAPLEITEEDGDPSTFPYQVKFSNGTVTDNGDGTTSVSTGGGSSSDPTFTGDVTIEDTTPSLVFTDTDASQDDWELIAEGSTFRIVNTTDRITSLIHYADNSVGLGEIGFAPAYVRLVSDGTGDHELILPGSSVGLSEVAADNAATAGTFLSVNSAGTAYTYTTPSGSGDVTAAANMTDHALIRGDGGAKGIQDSGITVDDSDNVTGLAGVTATSFIIGADTLDTNEWANLDGQDQAVATTSSPQFASDITLTGSSIAYKFNNSSGSDWEIWQSGSTLGISDTTNTTQHLFVNSTGLHTVTKFTADNGADLYGVVNLATASVVHQPKTIFSKTLAFPDTLQTEQDNWALFPVEAPEFPFGLRITKVTIQSDASTTLTYNLEEWTSPTDGSPSTICSLPLSSATENTVTVFSDSDIAAGSIIMVDLDTTDLSAVTITVWGNAKTS